MAARVDAILESLRSAGHRLVEAGPASDDVLEEIHDPDLLAFLRTAADRWAAGPYSELVGQDRVVPYLFPTPAMTGGLPTRRATAVHADAGRFGYDTTTLVGPGTWAAARAAVDCALGAAALVTAGEPLAYALCRPPGHHVTRAGYGGSCYLNNAAAAAQALRRGGARRVAVVDVDAHHGNGTAAIFYDRGDVLYGSVHVDPGAGWFPHVVGFADEVGVGAGAGATRNIPLAPGTADDGWLDAVRRLADWVAAAGLHRAGGVPGRGRGRRRPGEPACWSPATAIARPEPSSVGCACLRWWSRRAATTCRPWAVWSRRTSRATPRRHPEVDGEERTTAPGRSPEPSWCCARGGS